MSCWEKVTGIPGWQSVIHTLARGQQKWATCFSWPWSLQLDLGVCLAAGFKPQPILRVLVGQSRLFTHLLFPDPLAEPLAPVIHPDTLRKAQSQPAASSLQISLRLQKGGKKITCKRKDMHANMLFMCFHTLHVRADIYACSSAHTYAFFGYLYPTG